MSSLSSQLAAIHNNNNANTTLVGQNVGASKRHDEAVGRGIRHSAQIGYSLAVGGGGGKVFKKASVLHDEDTVEDIPLTTLRENCVSCLQQLQRLDPFFGDTVIIVTLCGPHSLSYERGLQTPAANVKTDQLLRQLLLHIGTVFGEEEDRWKQAAMHVLEYLLRRYEVHVHLASDLVLNTLPQHDSPLFARIIQLVDLTAIPSHWLFLRPYAAPGISPIARATIAKHATNEETFLVQLCQLAQKAASVHNQNYDEDGDEEEEVVPFVRRGISLILSFVAAVLVEAIVLATKNTAQYQMKDSTVRCLLPYILDAVQAPLNSCPDWKSFGYVLTSTLLDHCTLNNDVMEVLANSILKGVLVVTQNDTSIQTLENISNAIVAVYSILTKYQQTSSSKEKQQSSVSLGCQMPMSTYRAMLKLQDLLPSALGYLFEDRDLDIQPLLESLLSKSISRLLPNNDNYKDQQQRTSLSPAKQRKSLSKQEARANQAMTFILSLLKQSSLRPIWSDNKTNPKSLSALISDLLVTTFCSSPEEHRSGKKNSHLSHFQTLLDTIRSLNAASCDAGIASAINSLTHKKKLGGNGVKNNGLSTIARRLSQLLTNEQEITKHKAVVSTSRNGENHSLINGNNKKDGNDAMITDFDYVLPPRVALEHPNSIIRLRAIRTLLKEGNKETNDVDRDMAANDDLGESLIRRLISDDNADVAAAAANGVRSLYLREENSLSDVFFLKQSVTENLIVGLTKWSIILNLSNREEKQSTNKRKLKKSSKQNGKENSADFEITDSQIDAMNASIQLCSLALQNMSKEMMDLDDDISSSGDDSARSCSLDSFDSLMVGLISHFGLEKMMNKNINRQASTKKIIENSISQALLITVDASDPCEGDILSELTRNISCTRIIKKFVNKESNAVHKAKATNAMRQTFLINALRSYENNLQKKDYNVNVKVAASLVLLILKVFPSKVNTINLSNCLNNCLAKLIEKRNSEQVSKIMLEVAQLEFETKTSSSKTKLLLSMMLEIDSQYKVNGSSLVLLFEAASQLYVESSSVCFLVEIAKAYMSKTRKIGDHIEILKYSSTMTLALMGHDDVTVRHKAISLLNTLGGIDHNSSDESLAIQEICNLMNSSPELSSIIRGNGNDSLPKFFQQAVLQSKNPSAMKKLLLEGFVVEKTIMQKLTSKVGILFGTGTNYSASILLAAMESAGEDSFPLQERWEQAGKTILSSALEADSTMELSKSTELLIETAVTMLKGIKIDNDDVARASNVIITLGPSRRSYSIGAASDGVSTIDPYPEVMQTFILKCLNNASNNRHFSTAKTLSNALCIRVLGSTTWSQIIFPKIKIDFRKQILLSLLSLRSINGLESAGTALQSLPLGASDFIHLLESEDSAASSTTTTSLIAISFVSEIIQARHVVLSYDKNIMDLSSTLFEWLSLVSKRCSFISGNLVEGSEYTCASILHALLSFHENIKKIPINEDHLTPSRKERRSPKSKRNPETSNLIEEKIAEHARLIVSLLGGHKDSQGNNVESTLSRSAKASAISLLTHLCSLAPTAVVSSLLPAVMNVISSYSVGDQMKSIVTQEPLSNTVGDALMAVVPAYCTHAKKVGMSIAELLCSFIMKCDLGHDIQWKSRLNLYRYLVDALLVVPNEKDAGKAIASLICLTMADEAFRLPEKSTSDDSLENEENPIEFAYQLSLRTNSTNQISAAIEILDLVSIVMLKLTVDDDQISFDKDSRSEDFKVCGKDIILMTLNGPSPSKRNNDSQTLNDKQKNSLRWLVVSSFTVVDKILNCRSVIKLVRDDNNPLAESCLRMWQDLMQIQSTCTEARETYVDKVSRKDKKIKFLDECSIGAGRCLTTLQQTLPAPHFLACISSLMNDDEISSTVKTKSISFLSDRASLTDPHSPEASLFLEVVPDLISVVAKNSKSSEGSRCDTVVQQAALIAIEQIARSLGLTSGNSKIKKRSSMIFGPTLKVITQLLNQSASSLIQSELLKGKSDSESHYSFNIQVLSTAALCASTLVHLLKAKCLPQLPKLAKPLLASLSRINAVLESSTSNDMNYGIYQSSKLLQLAILRTMVSVAETLPQFLVPYLDMILSPNTLPCSMLRHDHNEDAISVKMMAERFDKALSSRSPCRQLVPALSKAVAKCFIKDGKQEISKWKEALSLLMIFKASIENASQSDLGPVIGKIVKSLIQVYEFDEDDTARSLLLESANKVLIAIVMKLSEVQLRPIYAKLRDWRGEISANSDRSAFLKRHAFWSLSAALSRELRSIFLPCISSVVPDIVSELEHAVSCLCVISTESLKGDKKRRKLKPSSDTTIDKDSIMTVQPLLLCLELALKADAHEGGNWTRGGEGKRYNTILKHLGKLLQAKIPMDVSFSSDENGAATNPFDTIVSGIGAEEYGSVSGCLVSLAAAAGNEQMWKPLNHAVLEACGNESRPEVRKAGVRCLLSIIESLGEEYMVLLPECLPTLSELLEDEDEETAGLARECVRTGEELLGESLDESLR